MEDIKRQILGLLPQVCLLIALWLFYEAISRMYPKSKRNAEQSIKSCGFALTGCTAGVIAIAIKIVFP